MTDMTIDFAGPPGTLTPEQAGQIAAATSAVATEAASRIAADAAIVNRDAVLFAFPRQPIWDAIGEYGAARTVYLPLSIYGERAGGGLGGTVENAESPALDDYCAFAIPDDGALHAVLYDPVDTAYALYTFDTVPLVPNNLFTRGHLVCAIWNDTMVSAHDFVRTDREMTKVSALALPGIDDLGGQLGEPAVYLPRAIYAEQGRIGFGSSPVTNPEATELAGYASGFGGYAKLPAPNDGKARAIVYRAEDGGSFAVYAFTPGEPLVEPGLLRGAGILIATIWNGGIATAFEFVSPGEMRLVKEDWALPPALWLTKERPAALNFQNAARGRLEPRDYSSGFTSTPPGNGPTIRAGGLALSVDAVLCGTVADLDLRQKDAPSNRVHHSFAVNAAEAAGTGSPRVLMIGDSLTNRYMTSLVKANLQGRGFTPTMVGTIAQLGGESGEAREGRQWGEYIRKVTGSTIFGPDMQPVADGGEAAYLELGPADKINYNPFIRVATGGDPAGRVFNGYIFDLAFYLSRFGYAAPTHIMIALGTNDISAQSDATALANCLDGYDVMVAQIRAALPTVKIGIAQHVLGRHADDARWRRHHALIRALIGRVRVSGDANIAFLPCYLHQSMDVGWPLAAGSTDALTGTKQADVSDFIHFDAPNRSAAAECVASWVAQ